MSRLAVRTSEAPPPAHSAAATLVTVYSGAMRTLHRVDDAGSALYFGGILVGPIRKV